MALDPTKGYAALRRGRISQPSATYFLTLCTAERRGELTSSQTSTRLWAEIEAMESDTTWHLRSAVLMPDHLHLLVVLGERLSLRQTMQRLKAKTAAALRSESLAWQTGFFDHRLRADDDVTPVFLYIYLNPYRAKLVETAEMWPHYRCGESDWRWFRTKLEANLPPPEWLL